MTKKTINQLVKASYTNGSLNNKVVEKIALLLSRKDVKLYIRGLKLAEKTMTISLVLPDAKLYNTTRKAFEDSFKSKRIVVEEDPSLLLGFKIIDNDMVYDMSLKTSLENFTKTVIE